MCTCLLVQLFLSDPKAFSYWYLTILPVSFSLCRCIIFSFSLTHCYSRSPLICTHKRANKFVSLPDGGFGRLSPSWQQGLANGAKYSTPLDWRRCASRHRVTHTFECTTFLSSHSFVWHTVCHFSLSSPKLQPLPSTFILAQHWSVSPSALLYCMLQCKSGKHTWSGIKDQLNKETRWVCWGEHAMNNSMEEMGENKYGRICARLLIRFPLFSCSWRSIFLHSTFCCCWNIKRQEVWSIFWSYTSLKDTVSEEKERHLILIARQRTPYDFKLQENISNLRNYWMKCIEKKARRNKLHK